ncbi:MAG TPA: molecular chaperone HtpG, partial [Acetobacteraceae bacterium]|nr:molecular chaperone HtpG [Acetobacteraceae bacterium]
VLLLPDPIDAFWPDRLDRFDGKPVRSVRRAAADLGEAAAPAADAPDPAPLIAALKTALGEAVSEVRVSASLVDSPVMLAAATTGPDLHMQRLLRRAGRDMPGAPPVLEINPRHALIAALIAGAENGAEIGDAAHILLDLARVQEGEAPADPAAFVRRIAGRLAPPPSAA